MKPGIIVSFEGLDGCGKSTQAQMFCAYLTKNSVNSVLLREPGSTQLSNQIRKLLLNSSFPICPWSELFLYLASRAQLLSEKIKPLTKNGCVLVLDRYIDSTIAYQGYGRELPVQLIETIEKSLLGDFIPNITFLIDELPGNLAAVLDKKEKDRIENETIAFQEKVRAGYLKIAGQKPRIKVIKRGSVNETFEEIQKQWEKFTHESARDKGTN